jgi:hypothetical protein
MKREDVLKEMRESIGTKDPLVFFAKMVDVFTLMFDHIEHVERDLHRVRMQSALAIQWEPKVASELLAKQVTVLRQDKDTYSNEISALKQAYAEDKVTQTYQEFCEFWETTLGWHPFLD